MLIKSADDKQAMLDALAAKMNGTDHASKQAKDDFYRLRSGIQGEADSAYFINFDYGESSKNWATIHDLRLQHSGRVAQIDHLLINRWMEFYVIETKSFNSGIKITEEGEFLRWNEWRKKYEAMESPIEQNERHIAVLKDVVSTLDWPQRFGMRLPPEFMSLVLISTKAKVLRPKLLDTSRVIKADTLKKRIWRDMDDENPLLTLLKVGKIVSSETVRDIAMQLVARHQPLPAPLAQARKDAPAIAPQARPAQATVMVERVIEGPRCKACGKIDGQILYGKYGYYFKCTGCQSNTAIRFTCIDQHSPRLRKDGNAFFRECAECGSSHLYHLNR